jgi:hypothetical protein
VGAAPARADRGAENPLKLKGRSGPEGPPRPQPAARGRRVRAAGKLLGAAGLEIGALKLIPEQALTEADVAAAVADGRADAGLGIAAVAHQYRLGFVPLVVERYDLALWRAAYFEGPAQKLLAFAKSERFAGRAEALTGYDVAGLGTVHYNAP